VCTENLIRIDCVTESPNVNGDDRALLPLADPVRLAVQVEEPTFNVSHVHAGHQSSPGTGESHFRVLVMSPEFAGKSRVGRLSFPKIPSGLGVASSGRIVA
jgi:hypothetical protein